MTLHAPLCSDCSRYSERASVATAGPLPCARADRRMFAARPVFGWLCLHAAPDGAGAIGVGASPAAAHWGGFRASEQKHTLLYWTVRAMVLGDVFLFQ